MKNAKLAYAEKVCKALRANYEVEACAKMVLKGNSEIPAVIVKSSEDEAFSGKFYVDGFERAGFIPQEAAAIMWDDIMDTDADQSNMADLVEKLEDFENIKDHIFWQLFSAEKEETIKKSGCVCKKALGLLIVPDVRFADEDGVGIICRVNKAFLKVWDVTEDEVFQIAAENISENTYIQDITDISDEDLEDVEEDGEEDYSELYAISFCDERGAGAMFNIEALKDLCSEIKMKALYILPSSIHEAILIPTNALDPDEVVDYADALQGVNKDNPASERLTNSLYFFDGKTIRYVK